MKSKDIFHKFILPELLKVAEKFKITDSILSISLYGSSNYSCFDNGISLNCLRGESDYDIWILFRKNEHHKAMTYATIVLGENFMSTVEEKNFVLYNKFHIKKMGPLLVAIMITIENCHDLLQKKLMLERRSISISWFRPRARERPPVVPVCSVDKNWLIFDMKQEYLKNLNLWKLTMPAIVFERSQLFLGTFIECSLTGHCFFGKPEEDSLAKKELFINAIEILGLRQMEYSKIPAHFYSMLTLEKKAGPLFKREIIEKFFQWLSA